MIKAVATPDPSGKPLSYNMYTAQLSFNPGKRCARLPVGAITLPPSRESPQGSGTAVSQPAQGIILLQAHNSRHSWHFSMRDVQRNLHWCVASDCINAVEAHNGGRGYIYPCGDAQVGPVAIEEGGGLLLWECGGRLITCTCSHADLMTEFCHKLSRCHSELYGSANERYWRNRKLHEPNMRHAAFLPHLSDSHSMLMQAETIGTTAAPICSCAGCCNRRRGQCLP